MTTLRQMGAKIGSRVRFIEDPEGQWRTVKTDAELDYEHLLPWVVEDNARIEELSNCVAVLEAKLAKAVEALRFYAWENEMRLPSAGPWGAGSTDFGKVARTTLAELKGQNDE